jgi:hypothetical protein
LVEAQRSRRARQERAAFTAVQAILTPEWMKSIATFAIVARSIMPTNIKVGRHIRAEIKKAAGFFRTLRLEKGRDAALRRPWTAQRAVPTH